MATHFASGSYLSNRRKGSCMGPTTAANAPRSSAAQGCKVWNDLTATTIQRLMSKGFVPQLQADVAEPQANAANWIHRCPENSPFGAGRKPTACCPGRPSFASLAPESSPHQSPPQSSPVNPCAPATAPAGRGQPRQWQDPASHFSVPAPGDFVPQCSGWRWLRSPGKDWLKEESGTSGGAGRG